MKHIAQNKSSSAWRWGWIAAATLALSGCGDGGDSEGASSSAGAAGEGTAGEGLSSRSSPEPAAADCPTGGVRTASWLNMDARSWPEKSDRQSSSTSCSDATNSAGTAVEPISSRVAGIKLVPLEDGDDKASHERAQTDLGELDRAVLD